MATVTIQIDENGTIRHLSDDRLDPILAAGPVQANRASHVEPLADGSGWYVDLSPVGGPRLDGFKTREAALSAEVTWLISNNFPDVIKQPADQKVAA